MGRSTPSRHNPFRFFLNHSRAVAPNVYLNLYPKPGLAMALDQDPAAALQMLELLSQIDPATLVSCGRTYGGNLHKLEPKELESVPLPDLPENLKRSRPAQQKFPFH